MLPSHLPNGSAAAADADGGVTNGTASSAADAAGASGPAPAAPSLRQVCLELQDKVEAFLAEDVDTKLLKGVQAQVKDAVGVIDEALDRYRYAPLFLSIFLPGVQYHATATGVRLTLPTAWRSSPSPTTAARTASSCSC